MSDHFIAKNATAHKVNSCYTLAISYCTFYVRKHTILGPAWAWISTVSWQTDWQTDGWTDRIYSCCHE